MNIKDNNELIIETNKKINKIDLFQNAYFILLPIISDLHSHFSNNSELSNEQSIEYLSILDKVVKTVTSLYKIYHAKGEDNFPDFLEAFLDDVQELQANYHEDNLEQFFPFLENFYCLIKTKLAQMELYIAYNNLIQTCSFIVSPTENMITIINNIQNFVTIITVSLDEHLDESNSTKIDKLLNLSKLIQEKLSGITPQILQSSGVEEVPASILAVQWCLSDIAQVCSEIEDTLQNMNLFLLEKIIDTTYEIFSHIDLNPSAKPNRMCLFFKNTELSDNDPFPIVTPQINNSFSKTIPSQITEKIQYLKDLLERFELKRFRNMNDHKVLAILDSNENIRERHTQLNEIFQQLLKDIKTKLDILIRTPMNDDVQERLNKYIAEGTELLETVHVAELSAWQELEFLQNRFYPIIDQMFHEFSSPTYPMNEAASAEEIKPDQTPFPKTRDIFIIYNPEITLENRFLNNKYIELAFSPSWMDDGKAVEAVLARIKMHSNLDGLLITLNRWVHRKVCEVDNALGYEAYQIALKNRPIDREVSLILDQVKSKKMYELVINAHGLTLSDEIVMQLIDYLKKNVYLKKFGVVGCTLSAHQFSLLVDELKHHPNIQFITFCKIQNGKESITQEGIHKLLTIPSLQILSLKENNSVLSEKYENEFCSALSERKKSLENVYFFGNSVSEFQRNLLRKLGFDFEQPMKSSQIPNVQMSMTNLFQSNYTESLGNLIVEEEKLTDSCLGILNNLYTLVKNGITQEGPKHLTLSSNQWYKLYHYLNNLPSLSFEAGAQLTENLLVKRDQLISLVGTLEKQCKASIMEIWSGRIQNDDIGKDREIIENCYLAGQLAELIQGHAQERVTVGRVLETVKLADLLRTTEIPLRTLQIGGVTKYDLEKIGLDRIPIKILYSFDFSTWELREKLPIQRFASQFLIHRFSFFENRNKSEKNTGDDKFSAPYLGPELNHMAQFYLVFKNKLNLKLNDNRTVEIPKEIINKIFNYVNKKNELSTSRSYKKT